MFEVGDSLPLEDNVYRFIHEDFINKTSRRPNESMFVCKANEIGLSVDWSKLTTPHKSLVRLGISQNIKGVYKTPSKFSVFVLKISEIKSIQERIDVIYTPLINGNPPPIGFPNNLSHSEIINIEDDVEYRVKITDIAKEDNSYNIENISKIVNRIRNCKKSN